MARIRTIKPEFTTSLQITECSPNVRLTFILMWMFCDDYGIHPAEPKRLKMEIFPGDDINSTQVRAYIDELITAGLLEEYSVDKQVFWRVTGWEKHQKIDSPTGKYPLPDGTIGSKIRRIYTEQPPKVRQPFTPRSPLEKEKEKEKEKEGKGNDKKQKFGSFENVFLSTDELEKLEERFEDYQDRIERLSEYIETKKPNYKNHYAVILTWARNDKGKEKDISSFNPAEFKGNIL